MKSVMIAAAGFLMVAAPAFAQAPKTNATVEGTATTSGNGAGVPSASTPAGQIATTGPVVASPAAQPSVNTPGATAPGATADSTVTGTTDATPK